MKLLVVTPRLPYPTYDGGAVYIYNSLKYLAEYVDKITLASFISNNHEQSQEELSQFLDVLAESGNFKPYTFLAVLKSLFKTTPITIHHRMNVEIMSRILGKVKSKPNLILLEGIHTTAFLPMIRHQFPGVKVVLRQSNVEFLLLKRNAKTSKNFFIKLYYYHQAYLMKRFEVSSMERVDAVTAITEFDRIAFLKEQPNLNCFVSPAGATVEKSFYEQRKDDKILAISNWRWKPNYDGLAWFLDKVWPQLIKKVPSLLFDIIGDGLTDSFKMRYKHQNIIFHDYVENINPFRQTSTVFIAPLFSGSGMKLKIIEGLASGLPIVTTKYGAEGINIKHQEHFLEANTKKEFVNSILLLLSDKKIRTRLSSSAIDVAKSEYSWGSITKELYSFLANLDV